MYQTVTESDFVRAFQSIRPENFSVPALRELFRYLEELENMIGEQTELDPIAICCDWAEYTEEELFREYPDYVEYSEEGNVVTDDLDSETLVIGVSHYEGRDTYLVLSF